MILIEIITVLFAGFLAYLNEVPVVKMINYGASLKEEKDFHRANALVKIIYSLVVSYAWFWFSWKALVLAVLLGLIQWVVFDITLNLLLKKTWDYIGDTAGIDKKLNKMFSRPGETKAIVCIGLIILLNIILYGTYLK